MRSTSLVVVCLVALSLAPSVGVGAATEEIIDGKLLLTTESTLEKLPSCAEFTSCAECVFDATYGLMTKYANCTWCPSNNTCVETSKKAASMCPGGQFFGGLVQPQCSEMTCVAAEGWTNLYFCRPWSRAVLCFAIILAVFSLFFYFWWLRAVTQKPWKYPRLHDVLDNHVSDTFLSELRTNEVVGDEAAAASAATAGGSVGVPVQADDASEVDIGAEFDSFIICQICKVRSPSHNGDAVCAWCNIARLSFMPLLVASTVSVTIIVLVFLVGLKPWFADFYYLCLLTVGYGSYFAFGYEVLMNRAPIVGDPERRLSCFIHLALTLRGRKLLDVFPNVEDLEGPASNTLTSVQMESKEAAAPISSILSAGGADSITPTPQLERKNSMISQASGASVATNQSFAGFPLREATYSMKHPSAIPEYVRSVIDEQQDPVVWSYEPDRADVIADNFWLLHFFVSLAFIGLWMLCANMIQVDWALWNVASSTFFMGVGVVLLIFGSYFAFHTYNSTVKFYVMTKKTLYAFSQNGSGAVHHATPIELVRCASIQTYSCFGHIPGWSRVIQAFSWTAPQEGRRMPSIAAKHFVGLPAEELMELRTLFTKQVNVSINSDAIKADFAHLRTAWTLHIAVHLLFLYLLPIVMIHTYMMPGTFAFFGLVALSTMPLCFIYRGWRVHKLTVVGHSVAKENFFWKNKDRGAANKKSLKGLAAAIIATKRKMSPGRQSPVPAGATSAGAGKAAGGASSAKRPETAKKTSIVI